METKEKTNENVNNVIEEKKSKKWLKKTIVVGTSILDAVEDVALFTMKVSGAVILGAVAVGLLTKNNNADNADNAE